jgi:SAM-dependent methyltransferase
MSHSQQRKFLALADELFITRNKEGLRILEIGSYDVNGSIRKVFAGSSYTGVDLCEGPGVDVVESGHKLSYPDRTFDVTISMECFEHNPHWAATFVNMHRMTKKDGLVIVSCAGRGRLEHGTSRTSPKSSPGTHSVGSDYYRNLRPGDFEALDLSQMFAKWHVCAIGTDVYFVGWKGANPGDLLPFLQRLPSIRESVPLRLRLFYFPVTVAAALLPDESFQNFSLGYVRRTDSIRSLGRWLLRLPS